MARQLLAESVDSGLRRGRHLGMGLDRDGQLLVRDRGACLSESLLGGGQLLGHHTELFRQPGRTHLTFGEQGRGALSDLDVRIAFA